MLRRVVSYCSALTALLLAAPARAEKIVRVPLPGARPSSIAFDDSTTAFVSAGPLQYLVDRTTMTATPVPEAGAANFVARFVQSGQIFGEGKGGKLYLYGAQEGFRPIALNALGLGTIDYFTDWLQTADGTIYGCAVEHVTADLQYHFVLFSYGRNGMRVLAEKRPFESASAAASFLGTDGTNVFWNYSDTKTTEIWVSDGASAAKLLIPYGNRMVLSPAARWGNTIFFTKFAVGQKAGTLSYIRNAAAPANLQASPVAPITASALSQSLYMVVQGASGASVISVSALNAIDYSLPLGAGPARLLSATEGAYLLVPSEGGDRWAFSLVDLKLSPIAEVEKTGGDEAVALGSVGYFPPPDAGLPSTRIGYFAVPAKGGTQILRTDGTAAGTGVLLQGAMFDKVLSNVSSGTLTLAAAEELVFIDPDGSFTPYDPAHPSGGGATPSPSQNSGCSLGTGEATFGAWGMIALALLGRRMRAKKPAAPGRGEP